MQIYPHRGERGGVCQHLLSKVAGDTNNRAARVPFLAKVKLPVECFTSSFHLICGITAEAIFSFDLLSYKLIIFRK